MDKPFGSKAEKVYCASCYDASFATRCDGCGEVFKAGKKYILTVRFTLLSQNILNSICTLQPLLKYINFSDFKIHWYIVKISAAGVNEDVFQIRGRHILKWEMKTAFSVTWFLMLTLVLFFYIIRFINLLLLFYLFIYLHKNIWKFINVIFSNNSNFRQYNLIRLMAT